MMMSAWVSEVHVPPITPSSLSASECAGERARSLGWAADG